MHGIFYSQDKENTQSQRVYRCRHGLLLINGSIYNRNSIKLLDSSLENTKNWIRQLRGEYSFIYETDQHIVFGTDQFAQKPLWFSYEQNSKKFDACSVPLPIERKFGMAWSVLANKIYTLHKDSFKISIDENTTWNLEQSRKNYDDVFEIFEESVKLRHVDGDTTYSLTGGIDSGTVHCAAKKLLNDVTTFTEISLLHENEKKILSQRLDINHKHRFFSDPGEEVMAEIRNTIIKETIDCDIFYKNDTNAMVNYLGKLNKKYIISGLGGDALYGLFIEKTKGAVRTPANTTFPADLHLVFPWHGHADRLYSALNQKEQIAGYYGKVTRNPLLDQRLFQAWLNTSADLKNHRYKDWMKVYMEQNHYAY